MNTKTRSDHRTGQLLQLEISLLADRHWIGFELIRAATGHDALRAKLARVARLTAKVNALLDGFCRRCHGVAVGTLCHTCRHDLDDGLDAMTVANYDSTSWKDVL